MLFGFLDLGPFSKYFEHVCSELVLGPATEETERAHRPGPMERKKGTAQCLLPERCYDQGDAVGFYPDQGMFGSS